MVVGKSHQVLLLLKFPFSMWKPELGETGGSASTDLMMSTFHPNERHHPVGLGPVHGTPPSRLARGNPGDDLAYVDWSINCKGFGTCSAAKCSSRTSV